CGPGPGMNVGSSICADPVATVSVELQLACTSVEREMREMRRRSQPDGSLSREGRSYGDGYDWFLVLYYGPTAARSMETPEVLGAVTWLCNLRAGCVVSRSD